MLENILEKVNDKSKFLSLYEKIRNKENCSCFGLNFSEISLFLTGINEPKVLVVNSLTDALKYEKQFKSLNLNVFLIKNRIENYYYNNFNVDENLRDFLISMFKLLNNECDILIVLSNVLTQKLVNPQTFFNHILNFEVGKTYDFKEILSTLTKSNYTRVSSVQNKGEFSLKGDILDIFPINEEMPIRLDFFDESLENINYFNVDSFENVKNIKQLKICPNTLIFYSKDEIKNAIEILKKEREKLVEISAKDKVSEILSDLENDNLNVKSCYFLPFLFDNSYTILSYLNKNGIVIFNEPKLIIDNINACFVNHLSTINSLNLTGEVSLLHKDVLINKNNVFNTKNTKLAFLNLNTSNRIFESDFVFSFLSSYSKNYNKNFNLIKSDTHDYLSRNYRVIFCIKSNSLAVSFQNFLKENSIISTIITNINQIKDDKVYILVSHLLYGAILPEDNLAIISNFEIYGQNEIAKEKENSTKVFTLPKIGDYVVHAIHGICKCLNIENITYNGFSKDYIVLQFKDNDKLYLPTEKANLLSAYIGNPEPKLNKMGGLEFEKEKQKVKTKLKEMAFDLLSLYAKRENSKGFKFNEDDYLQLEFENAFPYEKTADQEKAILDIKKDMTSGKVMDRLVCGDVGYGKTEVALVAAFKAILSGKQVAFLSPTTILSEQHYKTTLARMSAFMINVACLNRFKTKVQQKDILKKLENGDINIICGTHRLLSSDVKFKDLGLLILDEEQRFGVEDKEKIKNLKENIAVLTLSATPIPRTLHLSMIGVRDISIINTPPNNRMPVQTTVIEFSEILLKQAIDKELERNGQVLIIYNRVETIYTFSNYVRNLYPNTNIGVAHGQMPQNVLEDEIQKLYNEETQILISTVLIENGVDLPNANTLFVVNADKLGLSQLYQLRGRVGRSDKMAYAYFTYEKDMQLKEESYKRLSALSEFTDLGSGFKIAMRDLEIRGAGTILGKAQHGHIEKVGYDMYVKLLKEAVLELKGNSTKNYADTKMEVMVSCFIPKNYIEDDDKKFMIYEKISSINSTNEMNELNRNLIDNFKYVPKEVENLMKVALLKNLVRNFNAKRVVINNNACFVELLGKQDISEKINKILSDNSRFAVLKLDNLPIIEFKLTDKSVLEKLETLINIFNLEK